MHILKEADATASKNLQALWEFYTTQFIKVLEGCTPYRIGYFRDWNLNTPLILGYPAYV
jgi:hypothetical protein